MKFDVLFCCCSILWNSAQKFSVRKEVHGMEASYHGHNRGNILYMECFPSLAGSKTKMAIIKGNICTWNAFQVLLEA
jgi:hypothetical protein